MILARCPACATTFRVRPEQLRARQGRVRCGQCNHAFNALETLVDENAVPIAREVHEAAPPLLTTPQPSPDTPLFVLEEKELEPADTDTAAPSPPPATDLSIDAIPEMGAEDDEPIEPPPFLPPDAPEDSPKDAAPSLNAGSDAVKDHGEFEIPLSGFDIPPVEPDAPMADAWPAMGDEPAPARDDQLEPGGEIALPSDDEWLRAGDNAPLDASTPEVAQAEASPPADAETAPAPQGTLADDPLLEFGMDDDFPSTRTPPPAAPSNFQADWPDPDDLDLKASPQAEHSASQPVIDFDALLHKEDAGDPVIDTSSSPLDSPAAPIPAAALAQAAPGHEAPGIQDKDQDPADNSDDEQDDDTPPPSSLNQALWAAGATLLSLTLLAQGVLVFRNEIALSSPPTRPALEALCNSLGCELPLPREAAEIAIESSDIQPDAGREAFFTLHATLRNRAEFQQAWPHLEVTLTDARDKALVRRVLEPAQWLPADAPRDAFPARREIAARVAFEAPGVAAAGYRVYAFYP